MMKKVHVFGAIPLQGATKHLLFLLFCLSSIFSLDLFAQVLTIDQPTLIPQGRQEQQQSSELLSLVASSLVSPGIQEFSQVGFRGQNWHTDTSPVPGRSLPQYRLQTQFIDSEGSQVSMFTLLGPGNRSEQYVLLKPLSTLSARESAQIIGYLKAAVDRFPLAVNPAPPAPLLLDILRVTELRIRDLPITPTLMPNSLSVNKDGRLVVGSIALALEFDEEMALAGQTGATLMDQGNYSPAYLAAVSNAGTLFLRPAQGDEVYQFIPGIDRPRRIQTGITLASAMAVLRDGSLVLNDAMENRAVRWFNGETTRFPLIPGDYNSVTALKGGPDGNIWVFEAVSGRVSILSPQGELLDTIIPRIPQAERMAIRNIGIYEDGSFVAVGTGGLYGFTRSGGLLWSLDQVPTNPPGNFANLFTVEVDSLGGYIYLTGPQDGKIYRFVDSHYRQKYAIENERDTALYPLLQRTRQGSNPQDLGALAQFYQDRGAPELAAQAWNEALNLDPFYFEAENALSTLQRLTFLQQGDRAAARMNRDLEVYGVETARPAYQIALRLYEQALALESTSTETQQRIHRLQDSFLGAQGPNQRPNRPLRIDQVRLESIFPSLMGVYQSQPLGTIEITNTLDVPVQNVQAEVRFSTYMDAPRVAEGPGTLGPGERASIPLFIALNERTLELDENLPVLTVVEVRYQIADEEHRVSRNTGTTILRRTALSWDDSRKIMPFVTPNESLISTFAFQLLAGSTGTTRSPSSGPLLESFFEEFPILARARVLADGLGAYNIEYIEDPASPITQVFGQASVIDTVRFPRETLFYQRGDCDDTTALLTSLFEAAGIRTAIMTSPGHVFAAFNSRIPSEMVWLFETSGLKTLLHGGEIWIPLETTNLPEGFLASWTYASGLLQTHGNPGPDNPQVEFIPLEEHRQVFPSLPLPRSSFVLPVPSPDLAQSTLASYRSALVASLYEDNRQDLEDDRLRRITNLPSNRIERRNILVSLNKLAILNDLFGQEDSARQFYRQALSLDPLFTPTLANYAGFLYRTGDRATALDLVDQALGIARSPSLEQLRRVIAGESGTPTPGVDAQGRASQADGPARSFFFDL
ncbi:MAG: hypothetical protein GW949_05085 [Spirochaetales bacterium]|nr:hypothetical protein [Spirochaetales bacterium]